MSTLREICQILLLLPFCRKEVCIKEELREGVEWVVREGVGAGGRNEALYAHMNNKRKMKKKKRQRIEKKKKGGIELVNVEASLLFLGLVIFLLS
jgi:hypothetical protein